MEPQPSTGTMEQRPVVPTTTSTPRATAQLAEPAVGCAEHSAAAASTRIVWRSTAGPASAWKQLAATRRPAPTSAGCGRVLSLHRAASTQRCGPSC
eukprot:239086-Rhodomonas_salina.1